jgi:hypothetical protein
MPGRLGGEKKTVECLKVNLNLVIERYIKSMMIDKLFLLRAQYQERLEVLCILEIQSRKPIKIMKFLIIQHLYQKKVWS